MNPAEERNRRWRLVLGDHDAAAVDVRLDREDQAMDRALETLYDADRQGGLRDSAPAIARWLGDIRKYFPVDVVRVMQRDAIDRLKLEKLLLQPETLLAVEPDVSLVAALLELSHVMPAKTRETARLVVRQVVEKLREQLTLPLRQSVRGSLDRSRRRRPPRPADVDWGKTILANLKHYQPEYGTIVPERRIGRARHRTGWKTVILCVDQSASMAESAVYAGIHASVLASMPALKTHLIAFDTSVVDLTEHLSDPVELLFGLRLGGGTDIHRALEYCRHLIVQPSETILILISDLYEGGDADALPRTVARLISSGVRLLSLLALNDEGAPRFDRQMAQTFANLGAPSFASTPRDFPELLASALDQ